MNDLHELDQTLSTLLAQLSPQARGVFMRQVAKELRQRQQKHIQAQQNPDGSAFISRKKKRRDKVSRNDPTVKYMRRQLLGFTGDDSEWIGDLALEPIKMFFCATSHTTPTNCPARDNPAS